MRDTSWKRGADRAIMQKALEKPEALYNAFIWILTSEGSSFWHDAAESAELPASAAARLREMIAELDT